VEGGAGLFELVRKLVVLLPRSTVIVSCSADTLQLVADCVDVLPIAGAGPECRSYALPDGATLQAQLLKVRARAAVFGLPSLGPF